MTAIPDKTAGDPQQIIAELERKLDERTAERNESISRQQATAEILQVIARSPSEVQPVFEAVAERAMSLLDAWSVIVTQFDGEHLHFGAARGALPDTELYVRQLYPARPNPDLLSGRCLLERTAINCPDAQADPSERQRDYACTRGFRAALAIPMIRDYQLIGVITVSRREAGAFAAAEVELLQTFADQAVIAIQNARLFDEVQMRTKELSQSLDDLRTAQDRLVQTEKLAWLANSPPVSPTRSRTRLISSTISRRYRRNWSTNWTKPWLRPHLIKRCAVTLANSLRC
jgi:two-component system NtrC family sensor kinase